MGGFSVGATVTLKVPMTVLLIVPPSSTSTVMIVEPKDPGAGAKVSVPVVSGLVYVTRGLAIKPGLLEKALKS